MDTNECTYGACQRAARYRAVSRLGDVYSVCGTHADLIINTFTVGDYKLLVGAA